ncbi:5'-3' exonuclease [Paenibacillus sp. GSMTC-2017]|uniref:5'-3' exonuclease n=1 Tax=Paenibacillus sp. GSMTC-2017 TaxID=2794350 RepID=UPI0018D80095|nr:5'-3' exonuclease H3TH domain-containing protein [Paenibacillus sp. GSMTC-2017]MBH5317322.1 5'-3' exonuclease [Paenibacillus sp. GSMTC-2017]
MSKQRLLLVDGMAILFRAYFATSFTGSIRRTSTGVPVNAVHGFVRYFMDAVNKFDPTHVICCWDMGGKTFRMDQYDGYKSNRPSAPDDLVPQFDLVKEVVASFNVPNIGIEGYEADDCIGTLASMYKDQADIFIVTGDHDLLQLVDDTVSVAIMKKGIGNYMVYTPQLLLEERQLTPVQVIDIKGLMGDTSDNYPGVKGIGEKTAHKLIQEYGSIDALLANLDGVSKTVRTKIEADMDMLHLSRQLATICCDAPLDTDINVCGWSYDREIVLNKFDELEFKSLVALIS